MSFFKEKYSLFIAATTFLKKTEDLIKFIEGTQMVVILTIMMMQMITAI